MIKIICCNHYPFKSIVFKGKICYNWDIKSKENNYERFREKEIINNYGWNDGLSDSNHNNSISL